ncbi:hypothetical protein R3P38DRAFT_3198552 [Favolaschia claudopus]|uniref:NGN domain-containing protein n=1 Tax=Favolaschia claudopus TaxID=2862362 RepID=A0AAW0B5S5_9AGAR
MSKSQKKFRVLDFLDLAAAEDSDGEEEDEVTEDFSRAVYIDDEEDTSSTDRPPRFVADKPYSIDLHEEARKIEERYRARRPEATLDDEQKNGPSIFQWAHTMERAAGDSKVPVWMVKVSRGREFDVVGTILRICSTHTAENVLSATAPPSAPGVVYIECDHEAIVRNLQQKVAFIRRDIPPRQVPSTDFRSAIVPSPEHAIEDSTWVRIRRNNGYFGDLGWVQTRVEETPWYAVYVVPRMKVEEVHVVPRMKVEEVQGAGETMDSDLEPTSGTEPQGEQTGGTILPFGKKRKRSQPAEWQSTFFEDHVSGKLDPSHVFESSSGMIFHYGFMILSLPREDLTWHNIVPSFDEVQSWASSPFFLAAGHTPGKFDNRDEPLVHQFAASMTKAIETANTRGGLQVGDQVRVVADNELASVGLVLEVGAGDSIQVQLYDDDAPPVEIPVSQLVLYHRVGDFVQVMMGRMTGMLGWITGLDWPGRQVDVMYHASVTSEPLPSENIEDNEPQSEAPAHDEIAVLGEQATKLLDETTPGSASDELLPPALQRPSFKRPPPLRGLKPPHLMKAYDPNDAAVPNPHFVLPWSHIRPRSDTSAHKAFQVLDAPTHKVSVPRGLQDPYRHIEVKAFLKNIGAFFGSITTTSADGSFVWVKTEGRAINTVEMVPVANVYERHTGLTLEDYRVAPPDEIRALRNQQETARLAGSAGTTSTAEFLSDALPLAQEAWPEVLATPSSSSTATASSSAVPTLSAPSNIEPGRWILHPNLRGKYLDVIIHGATSPRTVEYNGKIGVIQALDEVKRAIKGSAKVRFGMLLATDRFIPVVNIFPLTTNEFEGAVTREAARCVLDRLGVYVIVIGPDATGDMSLIGQNGFTTHDRKVAINSRVYDFPIDSICRSDPVPRYI